MADVTQLSNTYSVFLSTKPYGSTNQEFTHICSDASFQYSVNYGGTIFGRLGMDPSEAIYTDGSGGAVGDISISGVRCNPQTSARIGSATDLSNADFYTTMRNLFTSNQMFQNAYILRIYNSDWKDNNSYNSYRELYVHIYDISMAIDWTKPNEMQISLSAYRRNPTEGFGDV